MIVGTFGQKGILLGLSRLNCERLLKGEPIVLPKEHPCFQRFPDGLSILICAADTEGEIMGSLRKFLGPNTEIHGVPEGQRGS